LTSDAIIRLKEVSKHYDQTTAVDRVSLSVRKGTLLVLLGSSGCGKTTLLRLAAGLERPESGEVWINGALAAGANAWIPPEHRQIGMVFQDYALFPHLTASQNIAFALNGLRGRARAERIDEMLALVGLHGHADRFPYQLSGGQQQRVALARALAPAPLIVLLDEPFSNLDAGLRKTMREEVRRILTEADATAIFVTHDQEEAMRIGDEIAVMHAGKVVQVGKPDALYRYPSHARVADFLGDANYLPGQAQGDRVLTTLGALPLARPAHGTVKVMIRPEALTLQPSPGGDAIVTDSRYYGQYRIITLRHADDLILQARVWAQIEIEIGDRVAVSVQGDVVAFSASEDG
jgi:iron(III) transport system ATP-binding protein